MKNLPSSAETPADMVLARYKDRIVQVLGVTPGARWKIQWLTEGGEIRVSAVKPGNLRQMPPQLF